MVSDVHGRVLLSFINMIDDLIQESASDGMVPVLDAVSTVRLLKALVRGAPAHEPERAGTKARISSSAVRGTKITAPCITWTIKSDQ